MGEWEGGNNEIRKNHTVFSGSEADARLFRITFIDGCSFRTDNDVVILTLNIALFFNYQNYCIKYLF